MIRYASVCSGVEAASLAWEPLGWKPVWFSEIEPFPCAVLKERFPGVPNLGDMTKIKGEDYVGAVDLLVGGTPCQDLSVAGKRAGLAGERSSLALNFVELAYRMECKWFVWENVPGCLSSGISKGADFATLLSMFTGREIEPPKGGWGTAGFVRNDRPDRFGVAYRVLDAQFTRTSGFPFAVPQRRRRVFVVGYFGDWTRAAEVLLEPSRLQWDNPSRFKARERFARIAQRSVACSIGNGQVDGLINPPELAQTLNCMHDQQAVLCLNDQGGSVMPVEQDGNDGLENVVCFQQNTRDEVRYLNGDGAIAGALAAESGMKQTNYIGYENHAQDSRIKDLDGVCSQISAKAGTGGCNLHLVQECYAIDSLSSNSMKSANPHSGFHKEEIAKTLDTTDPNPTKNQGGNVIVEQVGADCYNWHSQALTASKITDDVAPTIPAAMGMGGGTSMTTPMFYVERYADEIRSTLRSNMGDNQTAVAIAENIIGRKVENGGNGVGAQEELAYTQNATGVTGVCTSTVRRLLPVECERLMGFPDNWTRIPWKGKPEDECPDSPRYKACGNSMCVNVMQWIGEQIERVDNL